MLVAVSTGLLSWISLLAGNHLRALAITQNFPNETSLGLIKQSLKTLTDKYASLFRYLLKSLSPEEGSYKELHFSISMIDRFLSAGSFVRGYLWVIAAVVPLSLLGMFITFNNMSGVSEAISKAMIGYNSLFVISIFTLATLGVIILVSVAQYLEVLRFQVSIKKALTDLATVVGYGTLAGVIGAALLPLTSGFLNQSTSQHSGALLPSVLVDLPASGAILGYLFGIIRIILNFGIQSTNHFYSHFLMPSLFAILLYVLYRIGLNFELLYSFSVDNEITLKELPMDASTSDEGAIMVQENIADPSWILAAAERCGVPVLMNSRGFVVATNCVVLGLAFARFFNYLRARFKNLINSEFDLKDTLA
ncbi:hypothetical protein [Glutamicibacter sp. AOP3-A1-12]|uniref:hypothetical protein n=1 Tax=Glutamicibacter sp. AOP3-A1-12 TaxID=3457701 RepID=UPI0040349A3C